MQQTQRTIVSAAVAAIGPQRGAPHDDTAAALWPPGSKDIVGRVLGIDDIIIFHADSVAAFEAAFHASVTEYIAACRQLKAVPEKPASGKVMLRIAPKVHAAAIKAAAKSGVSLNKWAEQALGSAAR